MANNQDAGEIKIVDKRRFTSDGEVRGDLAPELAVDKPRPETAAATVKQPPASKAATPADAKEAAPKTAPGERAKPPLDFINFMASLATSAMSFMGVSLPGRVQPAAVKVNLDLAKEYIEIIAMLKDKTTGNLTKEEEATLVNLLTELQLIFVEASKKYGKYVG